MHIEKQLHNIILFYTIVILRLFVTSGGFALIGRWGSGSGDYNEWYSNEMRHFTIELSSLGTFIISTSSTASVSNIGAGKHYFPQPLQYLHDLAI